jgi:cell division protein FtsQ
VKTQRSNTSRSFAWDDEAPEEPLSRRAEKGAAQPASALPNIPVEMDDAEEDELPLKGKPRFGGGRFEGAIRPRRRKARMAGRVFLTLAAVGGLAACAFLLNNFLNSDARFRIQGSDNIAATGLTEVSRAELLPVFGEDIGRNIFFVPLGERQRQLEEIPWVEKATVMRLLPDQIRVSIVERQPVAFVRQGAQIGLVDASGVLLTMPASMMAQRHYSFPVVTGIDASDPPALRKARMAIYQRLLSELDGSGQKLSEQISEIDLSDAADARVQMPEQDADIMAHFGQDHFLERYQRYKGHIAEWRQQYPKLAAVDLRYDQQVVLEMATGSNAAQAGEQSAESDSSSGQIAENERNKHEKPKKHTSGAKAPIHSASFMLGINPRPTTRASVSAASNTLADSGSSNARAKAHNDSIGLMRGLKPPPPSVKAKTTAAKNTNGKTRTSASAGKVKTAGARNTSTKARNASVKAGKASTTIDAMNKKRAAGKRAALNVSQQKTAPTSPAASSAGQGQ